MTKETMTNVAIDEAKCIMNDEGCVGVSSVLKNRYDVLFLAEAIYCNPNGNSDADNAPRQDYMTGIGYISPMAQKRKIRDYVGSAYAGEDGCDILIYDRNNMNRSILEAILVSHGKMSAKDVKCKTTAVVDKANEYVCNRYWDARTFGAVLTTGKNAGQIRGAVQMDYMTSVDPIEVENVTLTRCAYTDGDKDTLAEFDKFCADYDDDKKHTMGNQKVVPYGLYVGHATISASLAERVGFTEEDLRIFFEAMVQMFDFNQTSSKSGLRLAAPLVIFKHVGTQHANNAAQNEAEAKLGCAPIQKLFNLLHVKKKDDVDYPRKLADYDISFDMSKIPNGVEVGFKEYPFEDIVWGDIDKFNQAIADASIC